MDRVVGGWDAGRPHHRNLGRNKSVSDERGNTTCPHGAATPGIDESRRLRRVADDAMARRNRGISGSSTSRLRTGKPQSGVECALRSGHLQNRHRHLRSHAQSVSRNARYHRSGRRNRVSRHLVCDRDDPRTCFSRRKTFSQCGCSSDRPSGRLRHLSLFLVRRSQFDDALDPDSCVDRIPRDRRFCGPRDYRPRH